MQYSSLTTGRFNEWYNGQVCFVSVISVNMFSVMIYDGKCAKRCMHMRLTAKSTNTLADLVVFILPPM